MEDYTQKYLKYKRKYNELKQQIMEQNGGALNFGETTTINYDPTASPDELIRTSTINKISGSNIDSPSREGILKKSSGPRLNPSNSGPRLNPASSTPKTNTVTKTVTNTYLYNPFIDPLTTYAFYPTYTKNLYYDYKTDRELDLVLTALEDDDDFKPRRRSTKRKTSKRKSKKTSKRRSSKRKSTKRKSSKRKSKKSSKRRSRK